MKKSIAAIFIIPFCTTANTLNSNLKVESLNGNYLLFSQKKTGKNIDKNAWDKLYFVSRDKKTELVFQDRFYVENGYAKKSPSGNYIVFFSVSGGILSLEDGSEKYVDRAYCSVIDMRDGCIVSDWDGEACGYNWVGNKDILASSAEKGADVFDFMAMRPLINKENAQQAITDEESIKNLLRCDPPNKTNIVSYQTLLKSNKKYISNIKREMLSYLESLPEMEIKHKAQLFINPNYNSKSKAYLIAADKVRFIQKSPDGRWINIGYINNKQMPLITWIESVNVK